MRIKNAIEQNNIIIYQKILVFNYIHNTFQINKLFLLRKRSNIRSDSIKENKTENLLNSTFS